MNYGLDLDKVDYHYTLAKKEGRSEQFADEIIPQLIKELEKTRMEVADLIIQTSNIPANKDQGSANEDEISKMIYESAVVEKIFNTLQTTQSMPEIEDIVDSLSENISKLVLKKFVYSRE